MENILATRYATPEITGIFDETEKIKAERKLWIAVMKAQCQLGVNIPADAIQRYEAAIDDINLEFIKMRERETRHDVKARIEDFNRASGTKGHIHKGMTSRDLTDNVEQMQIRNVSTILFGKYVSVLRHFLDKAKEYDSIILTARTHHQPAQPTLLGRRMAMWAEELHCHLENFERFIEEYPLRGIKGPVGTQFDMLTLLGSEEKVEELEGIVADELGFSHLWNATGQVYPRSLDLALTSNLALLSAACSSYALSMRLMSGYELVTEGFKENQVGSSAMPHKMNTRSSERIWSLAQLIKMYNDGASRISGEQWEEGDVSCSALRRVVIPDAIFASDGLCETTLTVLNQMGAYPVIIERELDRYLPFLSTTEMLSMAVQRGIDREVAHKTIKNYAVAEALEMRQGREPQLARKLAADPVFSKSGISAESLQAILTDKAHFIGNAHRQIDDVLEECNPILQCYAPQAAYEPREIL